MRLKRRAHRTGHDAGITLLELGIAILVLSIGTIAAIRATDQSRVAIGGAQDRMLAQVVARNRAEELRLNASGSVLSDRVRMAGQEFTIETETLPTEGGLVEVTIVARAAGGGGARLVVFLPGAR